MDEARVGSAKNEVPAGKCHVDRVELAGKHASYPPHELHFWRHLTLVDKLVPERDVHGLKELVVNAVALFE